MKGSGWGGMAFAKDIDTNKYNVTIISPRNYLLFTPLLSDMAFGMADISELEWQYYFF